MELTEEQQKRFWEKVDKTESCWLWTRRCCHGHGCVTVNRKNQYSHRVSWFLAGNTIPDGHVIRHKCRSRNCVNPDHLETGTYAENNADKIRDGSSRPGEKHHNVKLTSAQVIEIRARTDKNIDLAKEFGVSYATISLIIQRRRWKHI